MYKAPQHSRKLQTNQDVHLAAYGWVAVGMSLWYHPNAPTQLYYTTNQALESIDKHGTPKFDVVDNSITAYAFQLLREASQAHFWQWPSVIKKIRYYTTQYM